MMSRLICTLLVTLSLSIGTGARAQPPSFPVPLVAPTGYYLALGDSIAAGWNAFPITQGYVYQLYQSGVFGPIRDTRFANAALPGATSQHVLDHQVPLVEATVGLQPDSLKGRVVVTLSAGGNDLLALLNLVGTQPPTPDQIAVLLPFLTAALDGFESKLSTILRRLCSDAALPPGAQIYVHNLYTIPQIPVSEVAVLGIPDVLVGFNDRVARVVANAKDATQTPECADNKIGLADVFAAFRDRQGLLLIERVVKRGIPSTEVHPTTAGHRAIAAAFVEAFRAENAVP
jgi:lysophospholipase L1-like esterase